MDSIFGYKISDSQYPQMKIIETPKFILRPANFNDVEDIYEYLSQEKVVKYLPFNAHKNISDTKKFVGSFFVDNYKNGKIGNYVVYYKNDKKVIGNIGINNVLPNAKRGEVAVCLNPKYWGSNFSTELTIVTLITAFELTNLNKLVAITYPENKYTLNILKTLGFRYIKTCKPRSNLPASRIFKLKKDDYLELKKEYIPNLIKNFNKNRSIK